MLLLTFFGFMLILSSIQRKQYCVYNNEINVYDDVMNFENLRIHQKNKNLNTVRTIIFFK